MFKCGNDAALVESTIKAWNEKDRRSDGKKNLVLEYERLEKLKKDMSELFFNA